jgi:hypothetical protein
MTTSNQSVGCGIVVGNTLPFGGRFLITGSEVSPGGKEFLTIPNVSEKVSLTTSNVSEKVSFGSIIDSILADAKIFLNNPEILESLGLPPNRVYVLNGPLIGKSRLVLALAKYLNSPLTTFSESNLFKDKPFLTAAFDVTPSVKYTVDDSKRIRYIAIIATSDRWTPEEIASYNFVKYTRFFHLEGETVLDDVNKFYKHVFPNDHRYDSQ